MIWDLLDEDCSDISDWTDNYTANGVSQVDPAGQFSFVVSPPGTTQNAQRDRDIGSYPTTFTVELLIYHTALGTNANADSFNFQSRTAGVILNVAFGTDGLFVHDGAAWNEVGTNIVSTGVWTKWRFLMDDADDTVDIYKDDVLQAANVDAS